MKDSFVLLIIFIVLATLLAIALAIFISVLVYKNIYFPNHFADVYFKKIYKIAFNEDYRLINNFYYRTGDKDYEKIDHILFGEKYFYLIFSTYYEGNITGNFKDQSLIFVSKKGKGKKSYTKNQYAFLNRIIEQIANLTGLEKSSLIGIVLTNNDCLNYVKSESSQLYMIPIKELKTAIKGIESRQIGKLNDNQVQRAVNIFNKLNKKEYKEYDEE